MHMQHSHYLSRYQELFLYTKTVIVTTVFEWFLSNNFQKTADCFIYGSVFTGKPLSKW